MTWGKAMVRKGNRRRPRELLLWPKILHNFDDAAASTRASCDGLFDMCSTRQGGNEIPERGEDEGFASPPGVSENQRWKAKNKGEEAEGWASWCGRGRNLGDMRRWDFQGHRKN